MAQRARRVTGALRAAAAQATAGSAAAAQPAPPAAPAAGALLRRLTQHTQPPALGLAGRCSSSSGGGPSGLLPTLPAAWCQQQRAFSGSSASCGAAGAGCRSAEDEEAAQALSKAVAEAEARAVMGDPMSRLLASRGMPLGISSAGMGAGSEEAPSTKEEPAKEEPGYQMEAIDELLPKGGALPPGGMWGTTRSSAEEIARRVAESNRGLAEMAAGLGLGDGDGHAAPNARLPHEAELTLGGALPGEDKYKTLEQMAKDIKNLDEVFEMLASVPWLDENVISQKELKGVATTGLLGTLEEVGFNIRSQVTRIWAGEHDHALVTACTEARDQAALISILFHTKMLEEEYGPAPRRR
ncbi:hypothetical protein FOA52_014707 [Chlamydomonas sp. UWO 241]|nr:hypothetical protein FOA52_014707 [Chlamydomonas sp. UWO 241]